MLQDLSILRVIGFVLPLSILLDRLLLRPVTRIMKAAFATTLVERVPGRRAS